MTFLNLTERGLEVEEVNAVDVAQEIVEITANPKEGRYENKVDEDGELGDSKR